MGYTMIYKKDLSNPAVMELLNTIKEKNSELHTQICLVSEKKDGVVCREDVLQYFAEYAEQLFEDTLYIYYIASLMENVKLDPSWYQWFNEYFLRGGGIAVNDFMIVMREAVEKDIPLEETRRMFEQGGGDILEIYEAINQYKPSQSTVKSEEIEELEKDSMEAPDTVLTEASAWKAVSKIPSNTQIPGSGMDNFTGMFESLVKVMSIKGRSMDNEVLNVQDNLNKIIAKFQLVITELSAYSTEVIREWEKDKEENERIIALHNLQQKAIENLQRKYNELRNENFRLASRMKEVSKSEFRRAAISKKITELQSLASNQDDAYEWPDDFN